LALNLYPDNAHFRAERVALGMPYPQSPRPGLRQIQAAGDEWAEEKLHDLTQTFGAAALVGNPYVTPTNRTVYRPVALRGILPHASPIEFLIETEFPVGAAFQTALGIDSYPTTFGLQYSQLRPDIVAVLPAGTFSHHITPDGTLHPLPPGDSRHQLRVIDIKLTAQASPGYYGEVAFYSMVLVGWLIDEGLDNQFVVVP
jgi:hypothetical protein